MAGFLPGGAATKMVGWPLPRDCREGEVMSTTGWIILIVVLLVVFGGFGFSRRGR
jgi:hypothetical protein